MSAADARLRVVVIGAGIVGVCAALALQRDGCAVTIVEPEEPGGPQAASFGNATWISPSSVVPMSMPGLWRKVPGYLRDPLGPLTISWRHAPRLAPWLLRFLFAGATATRAGRIAGHLGALLRDCAARHEALAAEIGAPELIARDGLLYVYPDRDAFEAEALAWRLRRLAGIVWTELDAAALREAEPDLDARYRFGAFVAAGANCRNPGRYVAALAARAQAQGATRVQARADGFDIAGGRLRAIRAGALRIACDRAVIAAGAVSKPLAQAAGDRVSLESERGYHVEIADPAAGPRHPLMPSDGRMGNARTETGLRAAGQVELASLDAPPDWRRADILLRQLHGAFPGLRQNAAAAAVTRWMGHRPSTPDGLPVIGRASGSPDIVHAFGHGHVGLAGGPITGAIVADLIAGRAPPIDVAPFAATRFRPFRW